MVPLGLFGIWIGRGDLGAGATLQGAAEILGGAVLAVPPAPTALVDGRRVPQSPVGRCRGSGRAKR